MEVELSFHKKEYLILRMAFYGDSEKLTLLLEASEELFREGCAFSPKCGTRYL
jgi:hypothetical protein